MANTVPYTNARRAGRTKPDLVEIIERDDPRHVSNRPWSTNRRARRDAGRYRGTVLASPAVRASRAIGRLRRRQARDRARAEL